MIDKETICGILKDLSLHRKDIRCKLNCTYSDGKDYSLISICFYRNDYSNLIGKIVFEGHNKKVVQYHYKSLYFNNPLDVVDLLLDIYNHEANMIPQTEN